MRYCKLHLDRKSSFCLSFNQILFHRRQAVQAWYVILTEYRTSFEKENQYDGWINTGWTRNKGPTKSWNTGPVNAEDGTLPIAVFHIHSIQLLMEWTRLRLPDFVTKKRLLVLTFCCFRVKFKASET